MSRTSLSIRSFLFLLLLVALVSPAFTQEPQPSTPPADQQPAPPPAMPHGEPPGAPPAEQQPETPPPAPPAEPPPAEQQPATPPPAQPANPPAEQPATPPPAEQQPATPPPAEPQPATPPAEGQQADQDVQYTAEEYSAYQQATDQKDQALREDAIIAFLKAYPKSSLGKFAVDRYMELLQEYESSGDAGKLGKAGEKLLTVRPDDSRVIYVTGLAFFQTQNFAKAAPLLEKAYEKQPEPNIAFMLAVAYMSLGNNDKLIKYGEIATAKFEPKETYQFLTQMTRVYSEKRQTAKAAETAKKTLQAFADLPKRDGVSQAEWDDYVGLERAVAYSAIGKNAFERGNMQGVFENYKKSLSSCKKQPGLQAEAYYQIGRAYVKANSAHWAMVAFAKGLSVKGAPHQKPCKDNFEAIYKNGHNDSLAGASEFIQDALNTPLP